MGPWTRLLRPGALACALFLAPLLPVWLFDYLPLQDYPNHLARLTIISEYAGSDFYRENFLLSPITGFPPLPYLAIDLFVSGTAALLDTDTAMRAFISLYLVLYALSLFLLGRALGADRALLALFNLPLALGCFFHLGVLNFIFGIPLFLLGVLAVERYCCKGRAVCVLPVAAAAMAIYLTHLAAFVAFGVFVACRLAAARSRPRDYAYLFAAMALPLAFSLDFVMSGSEGGEQSAPALNTSAGHVLSKAMFLTFNFYHLPYPLRVLSSALFFSAVYLVVRNSRLKRRPYLAASAALFLLYLVVPFAEAKNFLDMRLLQISFVLLPLSLETGTGRAVDVARGMLLAAFLAGFFWTWTTFADFNDRFSTACASSMKEGSVVLPVDATPERPAAPYVYSWGFFLRHGEFLSPYVFHGRRFRVGFRDRPPAPDEFWAMGGDIKAGRTALEAAREDYDYVLLAGGDPSVEALIGRVADEVCHDGWVRLYRVKK